MAQSHVRADWLLVCQEAVKAAGLAFYGSEYQSQRGGLLRIYIHHPERGISLDDCTQVTHQLLAMRHLSPGLANVALEVSSPGIDRRLFTWDHVLQAVGEKVRVRLEAKEEGRREWVGVLQSVDVATQALVLKPDTGDEHRVLWSHVAWVRLLGG